MEAILNIPKSQLEHHYKGGVNYNLDPVNRSIGVVIDEKGHCFIQIRAINDVLEIDSKSADKNVISPMDQYILLNFAFLYCSNGDLVLYRKNNCLILDATSITIAGIDGIPTESDVLFELKNYYNEMQCYGIMPYCNLRVNSRSSIDYTITIKNDVNVEVVRNIKNVFKNDNFYRAPTVFTCNKT